MNKTTTWVRIPEEYRLGDPRWDKIHDPVVPLAMALYGHPDAGGYWGKRCDNMLKEVGWKEPARELAFDVLQC